MEESVEVRYVVFVNENILCTLVCNSYTEIDIHTFVSMCIQILILQESQAEEEVKTDDNQQSEQEQSEQQPEKDSGKSAQAYTLCI